MLLRSVTVIYTIQFIYMNLHLAITASLQVNSQQIIMKKIKINFCFLALTQTEVNFDVQIAAANKFFFITLTSPDIYSDLSLQSVIILFSCTKSKSFKYS